MPIHNFKKGFAKDLLSLINACFYLEMIEQSLLL